MIWTLPSKDDDEETPPAPKPTPSSSAALTLFIVAALSAGALWTPEVAQAQVTPSTEILDDLETRLLEKSMCEGACVIISRADIRVDGQDLTMKAEAHVQKDSGWYLPGPTDPLQLLEVRVDGQPTKQLRRNPGGLTAVRLSPGRHQLEIVGRLVNRNVITLQFDEETRPRYVTFKSDDWAVDGINDKGIPDSSLQLTRSEKTDTTGTKPEGISQELPPWYQVERYLALGMPWQVRTRVTRVDASRPQLVKLPLIEGEKIITENFRVEENLVLVDFPRGVATVDYIGEIPITPTVKLAAADQEQPWTETWSVECSRMWRCSFSKLLPIRTINAKRTFLPMWRPWPGEHLEIAVNRPKGTEGQASTVDNVTYTITPGKRLLQANLGMKIRASQGGWQKVTLPSDAELQTVKINNKERNIRPKDGVVNLPLQPGEQNFALAWQQPWERSVVETMPSVQLGQKAVNANLLINRGEERWLLWTIGPSWGPAILFWSHLTVLLLIAIVLGQIRYLHLKTYEWLLLVIGLAQLPVPTLVPIVGWFALFEWRQRSPQHAWWRFNLVQLGLIFTTLVSMSLLYGAIHTNLLFDVDMQVRGASSSNTSLRWYIDHVDDTLPSASIISLPILVWRLMMLAWALWLVSRLLAWVPWGWKSFSKDGFWRPFPKKMTSTQQARPVTFQQMMPATLTQPPTQTAPTAPAPTDPKAKSEAKEEEEEEAKPETKPTEPPQPDTKTPEKPPTEED